MNLKKKLQFLKQKLIQFSEFYFILGKFSPIFADFYLFKTLH